MANPETIPEMIARNYKLPTRASLSELGSLVFFLPMFPLPGRRVYIARSAMHPIQPMYYEAGGDGPDTCDDNAPQQERHGDLPLVSYQTDTLRYGDAGYTN